MDQHDQNSDAGAGAVFIESDRMGVETQKLYDFLTSRVIGQERAARYIARGAALFRANLRKKKKALVRGALLFAGPPGVGKTMMAEELSKYLVADIEDAPLNRIQCGRLTEKHYISELIGSPAGYVKCDEAGLLDQCQIDLPHFAAKFERALLSGDAAVKQLLSKGGAGLLEPLYRHLMPYDSVILFDEIERAHPEIRKVLLHIIGDGKLSMSDKSVTSFRNSYIVLTSNIGQDGIQEILSKKEKKVMGFANKGESVDNRDGRMVERTKKEIEQELGAPIISRLSGNIVVFRPLERSHCALILDGMLKDIQAPMPLNLIYDDNVREFLLDEGVSAQFGARELQATVDQHIMFRLANALDQQVLHPGDEIRFAMKEGRPAIYRLLPKLPPPRRVLVLPVRPPPIITPPPSDDNDDK